LLRLLYRLDMNRNGSLLDHERTFDNLVQSLSAIGKEFNPDELIVLYVPKLKCGLMAFNQLVLLGWTSIITKDGCTVSDGDFSIHSEIRNGLCV